MLSAPANLTVHQLLYLREAAAGPTFAAAAERLGVTQSALSQGIAELERRLGITLFERHGRHLRPRDAAQPVLDAASSVLARLGDMESELERIRSGTIGRFALGMIDTATLDHFPDAVRRLRDQRPAMDLHLTVAPSGPLIDAVVRGDLDLAIVVIGDGIDADALEVTPLKDEPLMVYAPRGARVGSPETWGPWATYPEGARTRALIDRELRRLGAPIDVVTESHQPEVLRQFVQLGMGWTVLPRSLAESGTEPLRRARRSALARRTIGAVRRIDRPEDPVGDAFVTLCR